MSTRDRAKKRVVSINLGNFGSTGTIMKGISALAEEKGYETYLAYPANDHNGPKGSNDIIILGKTYLKVCKKLSYETGYSGRFAVLPTLVFLTRLRRLRPDVVHLHNLHNSYINLSMLFSFLKKRKVKVIWTLHDCWAFTGHCPHFTMVKCDKWRTGCGECPQPDTYPRMKRDRSGESWKLKKKWFSGVKDMTIVTPSKWLADLARESFLSEYPVRVINNGIDLDIFRYRPSNILEKYNLRSKYVVLCVSSTWGERKGLDVFVSLASRLGDDYTIVLIGTDDRIDEQLPDNIVSVHATTNREELAQYYSAADLFVNPTREENYPTVNMEAIACGTPVLTFRTGGSPEIPDSRSGYVVETDDIDEMERQVRRICEQGIFPREQCLERAKDFDIQSVFKEYIDLY